MVLTKDELIGALNHEISLILHLVSKVDPAKLEYRPTTKQRSTLELLQYLTLVAPIHLRGVVTGRTDMDSWRSAWQEGEAVAKTLTLEAAKESIASQKPLFAELLGPLSDAELRATVEMFGHKASRGLMIVQLVLTHLAAYRMQLFLYLKASGREELNTLNLWVGIDGSMGAVG